MLSTPAEREEFLAILSREAAAAGLGFSPHLERDWEAIYQRSPEFRETVKAAVWRGDIGKTELHISDMNHNGYAWMSFSRGEDPALAQRFRQQVMRKVIGRWPSALTIPVTPTGGLPDKADLVLTDGGYAINPERLPQYSCPPTSGSGSANPESC